MLLFAVLIYLIWRSVSGGDYSLLWIYVALLVAIYGGAVLVSVLAKKNRRAYFPVKYTFDDSGVVKESGASRQKIDWVAFVRWRKIGAFYLIYQNKRSFFVVPKARIPASDVPAFETLLSRNIVRRRSGLIRR